MEKNNSFMKIFIEKLFDLNVLIIKEIESYFDASIYGVRRGNYESNYTINDSTEIKELEEFIFVSNIRSSDYGFIAYEDRNKDPFERDISKGYDGRFEITKIAVQPLSNRVILEYTINGDGSEIYLLAGRNLLYLPITVVGCLKRTDFWRKMLFQSYILYRADDLAGSFINMFIAFEGMLRLKTSADESDKLHQVYKTYTNNGLPKELKAYREIRNQLMHGNQGLSEAITEDDLKILLYNISGLYKSKQYTTGTSRAIELATNIIRAKSRRV